MNAFNEFVLWEAKSRDTIDFKKIYVDIADDLIAGLLLSQIIYWYLPDEHGQTKLRVKKEGHLWIAKGREDWWSEIRITAKQFDRAATILTEKGLLIKDHFRFDGLRMVHIRLDYDHFMELWQAQLEQSAIPQRVNPQFPKGKTRNSPKGKPAIPQRVRPLTETTPENTTDFNGCAKNPQTSSSGILDPVALANEICTICVLGKTISKDKRQEVKDATITLHPITQADLNSFKDWWYDNTWKGQRNQLPEPKDICNEWGRFKAARVVNVPVTSNGDGGVYI
jgi:hypothetical protein